MNTEYAKIPEGSRTILRATVGSTVHGTSVAAQDDRDEMAIIVPPPSHVLGLQHLETEVYRTQPEGVRSGPGDLDLVIHTLQKFARLAARGNPTILLPLFVPESAIIEIDQLGREMIKEREMFLSRRSGAAFLGYMKDQLNRLIGAQGGRHGKGRPELLEAYGFDTKYAGHVIRLGYQGIELMESGHLSLPMKLAQKARIVEIRTGGWTLQHVVELAKELHMTLYKTIDKSLLPPEPDSAKIDAFLQDAHLRSWGALWHRVDPSPVERVHGLPTSTYK
jgi:uncharacterized protein